MQFLRISQVQQLVEKLASYRTYDYICIEPSLTPGKSVVTVWEGLHYERFEV